MDRGRSNLRAAVVAYENVVILKIKKAQGDPYR